MDSIQTAEIMLCSWVFQFAEPHCRDGLDDLLFSTALM
jgi:hypothetical protein